MMPPKIAIIASLFNQELVDYLLNDALAYLKQQGIDDSHITIVRVPGAFEIPLAAQRCVQQGEYQAAIALGAVVRGETPHFDYVCQACSQGIMQVMLIMDVPIAFGVLTTDNLAQAWARAKGEVSDQVTSKAATGGGANAAKVALAMITPTEAI